MSKFEKVMALWKGFSLLRDIFEDRKITQEELDELYQFLSQYVK